MMEPKDSHGIPVLGSQAKAEMQRVGKELGIICTSCGTTMEGPGFEFVSMRVETRTGKPTVIIGKRFVCGRDCCAEAREKARSEATAVRDAGGWTAIEQETQEPPAESNGQPS